MTDPIEAIVDAVLDVIAPRHDDPGSKLHDRRVPAFDWSDGKTPTEDEVVEYAGEIAKVAFAAVTVEDGPASEATIALKRAGELVSGPRRDEYGSPSESFRRIARFWSEILGAEVSATDVALCMAALKISRCVATPGSMDGWVDGAGYMALGWECQVDEIRGRSR